MATISSVGTALPEHLVRRSDVKDICRQVFHEMPDLERLLEIVDRAGVDERHICFPPWYYLEARSFEQRNLDYQEQACILGEKAVRSCLDAAGLEPRDVDHVVFVTTTGLATPSVDALLAHRMGLRPDVRRTPLFGVGCAGGVAGLARAADFVEARGSQKVVVLSVELCAQTLQLQDVSKSALVGAALFGDGAAAALVTSDELEMGGPRIEASRSHLFPDSERVMGWRFHGGGMELRLQQDVPALVSRALAPLVHGFVEDCGWKLEDLTHLVLHPGGAKVLTAYAGALGLAEPRLAGSREFLRLHGNLSSASVLFIYKSMLETEKPVAGDLGLMVALGPGFAAEQLLLRWADRPDA